MSNEGRVLSILAAFITTEKIHTVQLIQKCMTKYIVHVGIFPI